MPTEQQLKDAEGFIITSFLAGNMLRWCVSPSEKRKSKDAGQTREFLEAAQRGKNLGRQSFAELLKNYARSYEADRKAYDSFRSVAGEDVEPQTYLSHLDAVEQGRPTETAVSTLRDFASNLMHNSAGNIGHTLRGGASPI